MTMSMPPPAMAAPQMSMSAAPQPMQADPMASMAPFAAPQSTVVLPPQQQGHAAPTCYAPPTIPAGSQGCASPPTYAAPPTVPSAPVTQYGAAPPTYAANCAAAKQASDLFDAMDRDGSGFLTRAEVEQAMASGALQTGAASPVSPQSFSIGASPRMATGAPPASMPSFAMAAPAMSVQPPPMSMPSPAVTAQPMPMGPTQTSPMSMQHVAPPTYFPPQTQPAAPATQYPSAPATVTATSSAVQQALDLFEKLDRDGSGTLTRAEVEQAMASGVLPAGAASPVTPSRPSFSMGASPSSSITTAGAPPMTMPPPAMSAPAMSVQAPPMSLPSAGAAQPMPMSPTAMGAPQTYAAPPTYYPPQTLPGGSPPTTLPAAPVTQCGAQLASNLFDLLDRDGSGTLTREEVEQAVA